VAFLFFIGKNTFIQLNIMVMAVKIQIQREEEQSCTGNIQKERDDVKEAWGILAEEMFIMQTYLQQWIVSKEDDSQLL